jgi:Ca2+-binding RTX toxin-like protein
MAIIGNNGNNVLDGGNGNDLIRGLDGDDVLNGKGGNDTLIGDRGSDRSNGGHGHDRIVWNNGDGSDFNDGGSGHDVQEVNGGDGDEKFALKAGGHDFLFDRVSPFPFTLNDQNIEKLELNGNGGKDIFKIHSLAGTDLTEVWFNGGKGHDELDGSATEVKIKAWGGDGSDKLFGGSAADELNGDHGDDLLVGNKGDDKHNGGSGHDTIVWNNGDGSDTNNGGAGTDTQVVNGANQAGDEFVVKAGGNDFLFDRVNLGKFTLNDKNIEKLVVNGGGGDDKFTVKDLSGTDLHKIVFNGGDGKDVLDGSKTHVDIEAYGDKGKDILVGGSGDDKLYGGDGDDVLTGGKGHDILKGGAGHDVLTGGLGADTFYKDAGDIITDFQHGIDTVFIV